MAGSLMGGGLSTTLSAGGAGGKAVNWQTRGPVFWCMRLAEVFWSSPNRRSLKARPLLLVAVAIDSLAGLRRCDRRGAVGE